MQVNNTMDSNNTYQPPRVRSQSDALKASFSGAITKSEKEEEGEFLGLTMLPEEGKTVIYGMRAMLPSKSTPDNPIVQIISNLDGKKEVFDIEINKINPENASRMEMFALCSYADKYGAGTGSTFGSFQTFRIYEDTAKENGCMKTVDESGSAWEQFRNEKVNWVNISKSVMDILKMVNDPKILDLFSKGNKLLNLYSKYMDR